MVRVIRVRLSDSASVTSVAHDTIDVRQRVVPKCSGANMQCAEDDKLFTVPSRNQPIHREEKFASVMTL